MVYFLKCRAFDKDGFFVTIPGGVVRSSEVSTGILRLQRIYSDPG